MTGKTDFAENEWDLVRTGPMSAGMIVVMADKGGTFKETVAIAKAYTEARKQHGNSQLLDELVTSRPERDHTRYKSFAELKDHGLQTVREAVAVLEAKAS